MASFRPGPMARRHMLLTNEVSCESSPDNESETREIPYQTLTGDIDALYQRMMQTDADLKNKLDLRDRVERSLKTHTAEHARSRLTIYGSTVNGLGTCTSDIDMSLCVVLGDHHSYVPPALQSRLRSCRRPGDKQNIEKLINSSVLDKVHDALKTACDTVRDLEVIKGVTMPLIKGTDDVTGATWQMTIDNDVGIQNARLLKMFTKADPRFAPLATVVKNWARCHGINSAMELYPNNYCWTLLVVFYLQAGCSPPVLPCLHRDRPRLVEKISQERDTEADVTDPHFRTSNKQTLGQLLVGFFKFYSTSLAQGHVYSIREGRTIMKESVAKRHPQGQWKCHICIEDPSSLNNVPRSVFDMDKFRKLIDRIKRTQRILTDTEARLDAILRQ